MIGLFSVGESFILLSGCWASLPLASAIQHMIDTALVTQTSSKYLTPSITRVPKGHEVEFGVGEEGAEEVGRYCMRRSRVLISAVSSAGRDTAKSHSRSLK